MLCYSHYERKKPLLFSFSQVAHLNPALLQLLNEAVVDHEAVEEQEAVADHEVVQEGSLN